MPYHLERKDLGPHWERANELKSSNAQEARLKRPVENAPVNLDL